MCRIVATTNTRQVCPRRVVLRRLHTSVVRYGLLLALQFQNARLVIKSALDTSTIYSSSSSSGGGGGGGGGGVQLDTNCIILACV
jgi:hypothetical protein